MTEELDRFTVCPLCKKLATYDVVLFMTIIVCDCQPKDTWKMVKPPTEFEKVFMENWKDLLA